MDETAERLKLLSIGYYVVGALGLLCGFFPTIHIYLGWQVATGRMPMNEGHPPSSMPFAPETFGWLFIAIGAAIMLSIWLYSAFVIYVGRCLATRRRHTLCVVVAALSCMNAPIGTVLGVFTLLTITKPEVKATFDRPASPLDISPK